MMQVIVAYLGQIGMMFIVMYIISRVWMWLTKMEVRWYHHAAMLVFASLLFFVSGGYHTPDFTVKLAGGVAFCYLAALSVVHRVRGRKAAPTDGTEI